MCLQFSLWSRNSVCGHVPQVAAVDVHSFLTFDKSVLRGICDDKIAKYKREHLGEPIEVETAIDDARDELVEVLKGLPSVAFGVAARGFFVHDQGTHTLNPEPLHSNTLTTLYTKPQHQNLKPASLHPKDYTLNQAWCIRRCS